MDTVRYALALLVLLGLPPAVLLWYCIHPFARRWRRLGAGWTYALLAVPTLCLGAGVWHMRQRLLAVDYGTDWRLVGLGLLCAAGGIRIALARRRLLPFRVLAGLPELAPDRYPQRLLTEGIYGRIRHPRYVELTLWVLAHTLIANYRATWIAFASFLPALYLLVVLEERELRERYGAEYDEYARRVPRFLPGRS